MRAVACLGLVALTLNGCKKDEEKEKTPAPSGYVIPEEGGSTVVSAGSVDVTFQFPASAAGQEVVLTPGAASDIGWKDSDFLGVIHMAPDGLKFDDPVLVTADKPGVTFANFETTADKTMPDVLTGDADGFALTHFSTLAVADIPEDWCAATPMWSDAANHSQCAGEGNAQNLRSWRCTDTPLCVDIYVNCCVPEGGDPADGCTESDAAYNVVNYDTMPSSYDYCDGTDTDTDTDTTSGDCLDGGTQASQSSAAGDCSDPVVIDMSTASVGDIVYYTTKNTQGSTTPYTFWGGGCSDVTPFQNAARFWIFHVQGPSGKNIGISVDAAAGVDTMIGVTEDPSCQQPMNGCGDETGAGDCERFVGEYQTHFFGSPYVVVAESANSGKNITVRFEVQ